VRLVSVRCANAFLLGQSTRPRHAAYCWKALENRKTNMLFKQLTCVGISSEREAREWV
jgi:hypothetical protein